jgi:hypothetical protein
MAVIAWKKAASSRSVDGKGRDAGIGEKQDDRADGQEGEGEAHDHLAGKADLHRPVCQTAPDVKHDQETHRAEQREDRYRGVDREVSAEVLKAVGVEAESGRAKG